VQLGARTRRARTSVRVDGQAERQADICRQRNRENYCEHQTRMCEKKNSHIFMHQNPKDSGNDPYEH